MDGNVCPAWKIYKGIIMIHYPYKIVRTDTLCTPASQLGSVNNSFNSFHDHKLARAGRYWNFDATLYSYCQWCVTVLLLSRYCAKLLKSLQFELTNKDLNIIINISFFKYLHKYTNIYYYCITVFVNVRRYQYCHGKLQCYWIVTILPSPTNR